MGIKSKILISALALSFLYGGYYWGIPALVDIEHRMPEIEAQISQKTGIVISVAEPELKMGITPSVYVEADRVQILNTDGSEALSIEHPQVSLRLLPLLFRHVVIDKLNADNVSADFTLGKDSKLRLGDYILPEIPKNNLHFEISGVNVEKYNMTFTDKLRNKDFLYSGHNFILKEFSEKYIDFSANSTLTAGGKPSKINIDISSKLPVNKINENHFEVNAEVENLDLDNFSRYKSSVELSISRPSLQ